MDRGGAPKWALDKPERIDNAADGPRPFISEKKILEWIRDDLRRTTKLDRPFKRYFTLAHLHNNPKVSHEDLRYYRAALSKICNSLSWTPEIYVPQALDKYGAVFKIDLRQYGWEKAAANVSHTVRLTNSHS